MDLDKELSKRNDMDTEISTKNFRRLIRLLRSYAEMYKSYSPVEFLDYKLQENEYCGPDLVLEMFLKFIKHEKIIKCLTEEFTKSCIAKNYKVTTLDKDFLQSLIYILVFELREDNYESISNMFPKFKPTMIKNLLEFVNKEEFLILATEKTCSLFTSDYTLNEVIRPLVSKMSLVKQLQQFCVQCFERKELELLAVRPLTKPVSPRIRKPKTVVTIPTEPVLELQPIKRKKIPATTYEGDLLMQKKLKEEHEKNKEKVKNLLQEAKKSAFACAKPLERKEPRIPKLAQMLKAKRAPKFKEVDVKGTTAMVLREAHRMTQKCEEETKKLQDMINHSVNPSIYENWEDLERKRIEEEHLQDIRKKHLLGLLSREEAVIAKQKFLKLNREKMKEFKESKHKLNIELEEWRQIEKKKVKELVEKSQDIQQKAKEAEKRVLENKKHAARILTEEKKELLTKAMHEKEIELSKKVELIKDVRTLQSLKDLHIKEFDPTETSNLGLLCEMSIAELQERLHLLKLEVEERQRKKREAISEVKKQKEEMLSNVKEFVQQNRAKEMIEKRRSERVPRVRVKDTPEIMALRQRVEEARRLRTSNEIELLIK